MWLSFSNMQLAIAIVRYVNSIPIEETVLLTS